MGDRTRCIWGHTYYDPATGAFKAPIYQTAVFEQIDRNTGSARLSDRGVDLKYAREENPTVRALERALASLEIGDDALAFSSGMAAISTLLIGMLRKGDRILVCRECYSVSRQLAEEMAKFGVECVVAGPDTDGIVEALSSARGLKMTFIEAVTNPNIRVLDVREVARACRDVGTLLVVDNTLATPVLYNPLPDGAWIVVHSATKYLAGHNDVVCGALIGRRGDIRELWDWRRKLGGTASPFEAFLVLRGLTTLELRVRAQSESARAVAEFLSDHPRVEEVRYPGLPGSPYRSVADRLFKRRLYGGMLSFKLRGDGDSVLRMIRALRMIRCSPSFGGPETLITCPYWSARKALPPDELRTLDITENLLRLSIGLEDIEDIIEDLDRGLSAA